MHGLTLESKEDFDCIICPLSYLRGIKKTLGSVGSPLENTMTPRYVENWNELMKKTGPYCESVE